ncbi:hypothetical protein J3R82DRAFT_2550 [Butyriboletus roseoflavus]|nr:hypothetical protein J3R82DRAFT_2550 [Butyriboletus roseoflavus]
MPAVRDPEPSSCEKWSYLNAFDPDSDEFFDNENAVYEDFIDPVTSVNRGEEEDEERDMLVVRMGNASPITSESSLSDSDSPLAVGAEDLAHLVDAFHDIRQIEEAELALVEPAVRVRLATRTLPGELRWGAQISDSGRSHSRRGFATPAAVRTVSYRPYPQREESFPVPAPSAPIPVPAVSRRSAAVDERALPSPSTPVPSDSHDVFLHVPPTHQHSQALLVGAQPKSLCLAVFWWPLYQSTRPHIIRPSLTRTHSYPRCNCLNPDSSHCSQISTPPPDFPLPHSFPHSPCLRDILHASTVIFIFFLPHI